MTDERPLTSAELAALPPGLVAAVPVGDIVLIGRPHLLSVLSQILRGYGLIVVRGRRIFWPRLTPDMSRDATQMAVLGHELVHVWQYDHGMTLRRYIWRDIVLRQGRYRYRLRPGKAFAAYGYEQQAAMLEDWMRMTAGLRPQWSAGVDRAALSEIVPFL
ncbi:MAG: hypothetical protein ACXU8O_01015 [Asticcacaulis sp.]